MKLFLHVSKEEQRRRLLARLEDPAKYWKFSPSDLAERAHFEGYQQAYEATLTATSTRTPPGTWCRPTTSTSCGRWRGASWPT